MSLVKQAVRIKEVVMVPRRIHLTAVMCIMLFLIGCLGAVEADSIDDIMKMLKAGVGEEVIKAHIEHKGLTFDLSTKDILDLKKAGASDGLLAFMIGGSGGEFPFEIENGFMVHRPAVYKNLAIFPVFRKAALDVDDYLTLDEAQSAKVIVITEKASASVPTVIIKNKGHRAIYIMAGEIIIGGKQDRMVSFDVLIPPGRTIEVEVRCVEHGRWHGKSIEFKAGGAVGGTGVRSALQFKAQTDVWDEVSVVCKKHNAETSSGTYGAVLSSDDIEKQSSPYLEAMREKLQHDGMVGMIMALNGEVVCVDIFANPKFFAKVKDKLLKAYVLDAISVDETSTSTPGKEAILAFFNELNRAETAELKAYDDNSNTELETEHMIGNEVRDKDGRLQHLNMYKQ
jgi:hypothetical protein